jgi:hypothetical protein
MIGHGSAGAAPRRRAATFYRRLINSVGLPTQGGHETDLGRALADLAQEVRELRSLCTAAHLKQSDQDAQRESAIREIGHRLDSIERQFGSVQQRIERT